MNNNSVRRHEYPAELVLFEGQGELHRYIIFHDVVLGSGPKEIFSTHRISTEYQFLAEEQCRIERFGNSWTYTNLGDDDTFTFVGGKFVEPGAKCGLHDGDVIRISNERMVTAVFLENRKGNQQWDSVNMDARFHTITINDATDEGKVSADVDWLTLDYEDASWRIEQIHSDKCYVNGALVTQPGPLKIDDVIRLDETLFVFEGSRLLYSYPATARGGLNINLDERAVRKHMRKNVLLKDINLSIPEGSLVMLLGGSGAGKTTLVNALTGYEKAKAKVTDGDIDLYTNYDQIKYQIGMVPQSDLMRNEDTVWDTLMNAAQMRLPASYSIRQREERVTQVLETFGLYQSRFNLVGKLSGGQRKRVSIGIEYMSSPSIFILDEPDSGLDGIMARELMENLRIIAAEGRIVIVITHTPDRVIDLFDKVIVLAKGGPDRIGQLAYYGEPEEAIDFFETYSMEGIIREVNAVSEGGEGHADEFIAKYKEYQRLQGIDQAYSTLTGQNPAGAIMTDSEVEQLKSETRTREESRYIGRFGQTMIYLGKQFRLFVHQKDWKVFLMAALIAGVVSPVIVGGCFRTMEGTIQGSLVLVCVCIWNGFFNSVQVVCRERDIVKREHRAGLHISSYIAAHMIYQAILCFLQLAVCMTVYHFTGLNMDLPGRITGSFTVDFFITMYLITYAADMMALLLSCIVHTTTTAMTVMPFLLIVQLIFSGFFFTLPKKLSFISDAVISHWGINAICSISDYNSQKSITLWNNLVKFRREPVFKQYFDMYIASDPEAKQAIFDYSTEMQANAEFQATAANIGTDWIVLIIYAFVCAAIAVLVLEMIDRDKR